MQNQRAKFMVDQNVGKLTRLLRMLGFDTIFFEGDNDTELVIKSLKENRILLTRDTHIQERNLVSGGKVKSILILDDDPDKQIAQVVQSLHLKIQINAFSLCLECNVPLENRYKEKIKERVPPYVFKTKNEFVECPQCHRVYWKGTHWDAMNKMLNKLTKEIQEA